MRKYSTRSWLFAVVAFAAITPTMPCTAQDCRLIQPGPATVFDVYQFDPDAHRQVAHQLGGLALGDDASAAEYLGPGGGFFMEEFTFRSVTSNSRFVDAELTYALCVSGDSISMADVLDDTTIAADESGMWTLYASLEYANAMSISDGLEPCYDLNVVSLPAELNAVGEIPAYPSEPFERFSDCNGWRLPSRLEASRIHTATTPNHLIQLRNALSGVAMRRELSQISTTEFPCDLAPDWINRSCQALLARTREGLDRSIGHELLFSYNTGSISRGPNPEPVDGNPMAPTGGEEWDEPVSRTGVEVYPTGSHVHLFHRLWIQPVWASPMLISTMPSRFSVRLVRTSR